jgi:hypothetical protein
VARRLGQGDVTDDWRDNFLNELRDRTGWNLEEQVDAVNRMAVYHQYAGDKAYEQARGLLQRVLGVTPARLERILQLDTMKDLRRAIRFEGLPQVVRAADERLYPRHGWLGNYLQYAQESEVSLAYHFWCGVALLGAACRYNLYLDMNMFEVWPNHAIILVGGSGSGKTQAMRAATDILKRANKMIEKRNPHDLVRKDIRLFSETGTPQRFVSQAKSTKVDGRWTESCGIIINDELSTLLGKESYEGGAGWVKLLTKIIEPTDTFTYDTNVRGSEVMRNIALSLLLASAPNWLRDSVTETMFTGGFIPRCVFVIRDTPDKSYPFPEIYDPVTANMLAEYLVELTQIPDNEFHMDEDAREAYIDWYHYNRSLLGQDDQSEQSDAYYQRKPNHVLRLAIVLALSESRRSISLANFKLAERITTDEEARVHGFFSDLLAHPESRNLDRVYGIIKWNGRIAWSLLLRKCQGFAKSSKELRSYTDTLQQQGRIRRWRPDDKGWALWFEPVPEDAGRPKLRVVKDED